jgi:hypothetical protein
MGKLKKTNMDIMDSEQLQRLRLEHAQVLSIRLVNGNTTTFIFYSIFEDGITGYGMHEDGNDLQFIPLSEIQQIKKADNISLTRILPILYCSSQEMGTEINLLL